MKKLIIGSLFSGIGAMEKGIKENNINSELAYYCEYNEHASECYATIHNEDKSKNFWDVTTLDGSKLPYVDLLLHGSPCQSISINGKQEGADEGSGTKSSLMWCTIQIVKDMLIKPKYIVWENVKNLISENHKHNLDKYIEELNKLGYKSYYQVLNGKHHGNCQNRDRVFTISILGESDFNFPQHIELQHTLKELATFRDCDDITDNFIRYYNENKKTDDTTFDEYFKSLPINRTGVKNMRMYGYDQLNRVTVIDHSDKVLSPTLSCRGVQNYCIKFLHNNRIYKPSPRMCFRLMGFTDEDFDKVKDIGKDSDLWDRAGNSIDVNVAKALFKELLKEYIEE